MKYKLANMSANLKVAVADISKAADVMSTYKKWFNGAKFFHTVKVLPPTK